jgi:hypothetical protein
MGVVSSRVFSLRAAAAAVAGLAAVALVLAVPARADDTFVVDSFDDLVESDPVDIRCQTAAGSCTLRAAVMQGNLNPGNTKILLPPGLFALTRLPSGGNGTDSGDLNLTKPGASGWIWIQGAGAAQTILDGGDLDRIFRLENGTSTLIENLTVRNGSADYGGGLLVRGALNLSGVRVAENEASFHGGGLSIDTASDVYIDFSEVVGNQSANYGGGLFLSGNADGIVIFSYGAIRDNVSDYGGGLTLLGAAWLALDHVSVSGNQALGAGGLSLLEPSAVVQVVASTIDGNRATAVAGASGGGIQNSSTLYVVNSTISGNTATHDGGGLFNLGTATLYNSTVAFNEADVDGDPNGGRGGGVHNYPGGTFAIRNSVFAGNYRSGAPVPDDCYGTLGSYGHNRFTSVVGCTITQTGACGGTYLALDSASELGPLRYNGGVTRTHAIQPGSALIDDVHPPCICQNQSATPIGYDQRNGPRIVGARCDVGAFEFGALPPNLLFADGFEFGILGLWN